MANKRMFSLKIVDTDLFLDMPASARLLYYDFGMRADDDGFVASPKKIVKMIGVSEDDYKILLAKGFIILFESGICVIRHWKSNNYIQKDRYQETAYKAELQRLSEIDGVYTKCIQDGNKLDTNCIQDVHKMDTQVSIDKISIDKVSTDKDNIYSQEAVEIIDYLNLKTNSNYRKIEKNIKHISARLKEGYTLQDFYTVIDKKSQEWTGTEYEKFLRPETLFGTKFDGYLNQKVTDTNKEEYTALMQRYQDEERRLS